MKPLLLFLSGTLLGACIIVSALYMRGPVFRRILAQRAASKDDARAVVALRSNEPSIGAAAAPLTMIEYSDFQCAYCAMFRIETFPSIKKKYIDSGQLRFVHRDLPLPSHPQAMMAAKAAACAGDQGFYWKLADVMFSRPSCLECQGVMQLSRAIPLNRQRFEACVSSNLHQAEIDQDIASARQLNFRGTPSFVVGRTTLTGVEGIAIVGALPFEEFAAKIDQIISQTNAARR